MSTNYYTKFYWNDWEREPALNLCSLAAQGLWMRMLCIMGKAEPMGVLAVNGHGLNEADLSVLIGRPSAELMPLLEELSSRGVFSRDSKGRIYSRRMVREAQRIAHARKIGKLGGNPSLCNKKENVSQDNPRVNHGDNPIPHNHITTEPRSRETLSSELREAINLWNGLAEDVGLSVMQKLTDTRKTKLKARLRECGGIDGWNAMLAKIRNSPFLRGEKTAWKADFDFVLSESKFTKIMEGGYDENANCTAKSGSERIKQQLQEWVDS